MSQNTSLAFTAGVIGIDQKNTREYNAVSAIIRNHSPQVNAISPTKFPPHIEDCKAAVRFLRANFTTAYDEYALRAFKLNGIDYRLKPIIKEELSQALDKFAQTKIMYSQDHLSDLHKLINDFRFRPAILPGFISYSKGKLIPVQSESVICFYLRDQAIYAVSAQAESPLEETLDQIEARLPKDRFFKANRQFIIHLNAVFHDQVQLRTKENHWDELGIKLLTEGNQQLIFFK